MSSAVPSTSLERTYRYLRIGVAGTAVVILVSVAVAASSVGWLPSLSDYYYTSARDSFVGALIAASLALLALSGRGVDRALLDTAALFAPLIALIPTTVAPGTVPGVEVPCQYRCFPPEYEAGVATSVLTYLAIGTLTVLVAVLLRAMRQVSLGAVAVSLTITVAWLLVVGGTWVFARDAFLQQGHFVVTIAFFALFAAVAVRNAFPRRTDPPPAVFRVLYLVIAALLVAVLIGYAVLLPSAADVDVPVVLIAEASALVLFSAFWVVQGVERWSEPDPALR
ncbi:hypothetical protein GCM10009775_22390 [Microbacterium aoyamense]|uniref:DUF998 domain-containing protein n=1 Tax=Microbacterium aoyamense TaxID=344166 RepID=A0ABN2PRA5_9MICO|nr:hypothetical protein [Microbacterium aoyamense]